MNNNTPASIRAQSGFSMIEVLLGVAILAIALLGHISTSVSTSRYGGMVRGRTDALRIAEQFVERLRADDDWGTLYTRLNTLQLMANGGATPVSDVNFNDGRRALPVTMYHTDFVEPEGVDQIGVVVDVPGASPDAVTPPNLREDMVSEAFSLPFDLNGDGVVDANPHNDDYIALPVVVRVRVLLEGDQPYEFTIPTWLRGVQ